MPRKRRSEHVASHESERKGDPGENASFRHIPGDREDRSAARRGSFADQSDRLMDAARPRLAVPGKHEVGGDPFEAGQRRHRLGSIGGERRDLRAASPRRHRVRRERVTDEERAEEGT
jgi:hypothetical protein